MSDIIEEYTTKRINEAVEVAKIIPSLSAEAIRQLEKQITNA